VTRESCWRIIWGPSLLFPFPPLCLSPSFPFPSVALFVPPFPAVPHNPANGAGGALLALPAGSGANPQPQTRIYSCQNRLIENAGRENNGPKMTTGRETVGERSTVQRTAKSILILFCLKRSPLVCSFVSCYFIPAVSCRAISCPAS